MKKLILLAVLLSVSIGFSQEAKKISTYNYGYNGMEYIVMTKNETTIVSTFNSKHQIRHEIATNVYNKLNEGNFTTGETIVIVGNNAKVTGKCYIIINGSLRSVNFYYEKVEWNNGLTEIYKKV